MAKHGVVACKGSPGSPEVVGLGVHVLFQVSKLAVELGFGSGFFLLVVCCFSSFVGCLFDSFWFAYSHFLISWNLFWFASQGLKRWDVSGIPEEK